jgi:hypothetical protein
MRRWHRLSQHNLIVFCLKKAKNLNFSLGFGISRALSRALYVRPHATFPSQIHSCNEVALSTAPWSQLPVVGPLLLASGLAALAADVAVVVGKR